MSRRRRKSSPPARPSPPPPPPPPASTVDPRYVAARELLTRARGRVTAADVAELAPSDPGYPGYVAAFTDILARGEAALRADFDVTETIGLTRWSLLRGHRDEARARWFRVLTAAAELLLDETEAPSYPLAVLLVDGFALADAGDRDAPLDLLAAVCREVAAVHAHLDEAAFCILGELLLTAVTRAEAAAVEALCGALEARDARSCEPWTRPRGELLWGLTVFDQLHPVWLDLVEARFPAAPPAAAALKARLLAEGARWRGRRRPLS